MWSIQYGFIILALCIAWTQKVYSEISPSCSGQPEGVDAVFVCQSPFHIVLSQPDQLISINRANLSERLQSFLTDWNASTGLEFQPSVEQDVEYWLSIPEANPYAMQARILIQGTPETIMLKTSINEALSEWTEIEIVLFEQQPFPHEYGYRVAELLLQPNPNCSIEKQDQLLEKHRLAILNRTKSTVLVETVSFKEKATRQKLLSDSNVGECFRDVSLNKTYEWVAWKVKAFTFPLNYR